MTLHQSRRRVNQSAPSWLLTPSALPGTVVLTAPLGSLVPLGSPWSVVALPALWTSRPSAALRPSSSIWLLLPSGSALVLSRTAFVSVLRCRGYVLLSRSLMSSVLSALQLRLGLHQHGVTHRLGEDCQSSSWLLSPSSLPWACILAFLLGVPP